MFGTRRLAKRSIIGTRVCAPLTDGRFYPGAISSTQTWPNGEEAYTVQFEDASTKTFQDKDLIGPGFQNTSGLIMKPGQKVYITYKGREVEGCVLRHDTENDQLEIRIYNGDNGDTLVPVYRRLEDARLMESRKSARLQDTATDYSRLANVHQSEHSKKREVSHVIDVPSLATAKHRRRAASPELESTSKENLSWDNEQDEDIDDVVDDDEDVMDQEPTSSSKLGENVMNEHMAAMVLTTLSCSPVSPGLTPSEKGSGPDCISPCPGSSFGSSGVWSATPSPSQTILSQTSPPSQHGLSQSAPTSSHIFTSTVDEGVEVEEDTVPGSSFVTDLGRKKRRASTRTVYKCTWPGCSKLYNTCSAIEKHVRLQHLGPKEESEEGSDLSDHEEEFYYTEVEVSIDTVTETFADMHTSSPPQISHLESPPVTLPDHDYQKKDMHSTPKSIPHSSFHFDHVHPRGASYPSASSAAFSPISRSLSWQPSLGYKVSKVQDRLYQHQAQSPKAHILSSSPKHLSPMHKKSRSDTKKCRKVYGMENRDMWCTQCKWKKACTRFMD